MNITVVAESASNSSMWHNRLDHMRVKGMKTLVAKVLLEGLKSVDMSPCENYVMSKQKRVTFTKIVRELKKSTGTTNQVRVEVELLKDSPSDVVADTQETLKTVAMEPEVKQAGVEVELLKDSPSDVADTQGTLETIAEEPKTEQVTHEQMLKRSSRAIRVPDRCVPSLHYQLVTDEWERKPFDEALQLEDTTKWEQVTDDGMSML